jgi:hypothetical protein
MKIGSEVGRSVVGSSDSGIGHRVKRDGRSGPSTPLRAGETRQMIEIRGQKSEVRRQKTEIRGRRSEVGGQRADFGFGIAECGFKIKETGVRRQKSEVGSQNVDFGMQIEIGREHGARCGSEVSNEKVWIKVCNIQSALKNGRNCVPRPTALTGYAKPKKKSFGLSLCCGLYVFGIKVAENE